MNHTITWMALLLLAGRAGPNLAADATVRDAPAVLGQSSAALPLVSPDHSALPTKLVWSDEFKGVRLDTRKWPRNGVFRFPGNPVDTTLAASSGETERYDPSEAVVSRRDGQLHLRCEKDTGAGHDVWEKALHVASGTPPYVGQGLLKMVAVSDKCGMVHTYPNYVSTPGSLIEMRVTLPTDCKGRWPAAWTFGYAYPGSPNPNAGIPFAGQENDIFEGNGTGQLKITLHNEIRPLPQVTVTYPSRAFVVRQWRDRAGKRVYEWIDGKLVAVLPAGNLNDMAMPLMLNMAGGTPKWAFIGMPDASTPPVCQMLVDYVRIYGS